MKLCSRHYAMEDGVMQPNPKISIEVTIGDWTEKILLGGVGRWQLRKKSLKIYHRRWIYDKFMEGTIGFEFDNCYKYVLLFCKETFWSLQNSCMHREDWEVLFKHPGLAHYSDTSGWVSLESIDKPMSSEAAMSKYPTLEAMGIKATPTVPMTPRLPRPKESTSKPNHLTTSEYMSCIYYEDTWVMKLEPMKWVKGVQLVGLLHMLFAPHLTTPKSI